MKKIHKKIKLKATGSAIVTINDKGEIVDIEDFELEDYEDVEIIY